MHGGMAAVIKFQPWPGVTASFLKYLKEENWVSRQLDAEAKLKEAQGLFVKEKDVPQPSVQKWCPPRKSGTKVLPQLEKPHPTTLAPYETGKEEET